MGTTGCLLRTTLAGGRSFIHALFYVAAAAKARVASQESYIKGVPLNSLHSIFTKINNYFVFFP